MRPRALAHRAQRLAAAKAAIQQLHPSEEEWAMQGGPNDREPPHTNPINPALAAVAGLARAEVGAGAWAHAARAEMTFAAGGNGGNAPDAPLVPLLQDLTGHISRGHEDRGCSRCLQ
jgi:hypothetical protein